jgi:NTP pyrophosphatase (non-canonical NTP hydrolase)
MDIQTYLTESERTMVQKGHDMNLLHGAIGICTEAGELLDAFKKKLYYGKELDVTNVKEEIGDMMWYVAILMRELNLDFDELLQINIDKLRARYPEKFSEANALNRDLKKERDILEGNS